MLVQQGNAITLGYHCIVAVDLEFYKVLTVKALLLNGLLFVISLSPRLSEQAAHPAHLHAAWQYMTEVGRDWGL